MIAPLIIFMAAVVSVAIVAVVVAAAVAGWGERVTRCQRIGLIVFASGFVLAVPCRFLGYPVGLPDLMMLGGLLLYLLARHLKYILRRADALDGAVDGRFAVPPTPELLERIRQVTGERVSRR